MHQKQPRRASRILGCLLASAIFGATGAAAQVNSAEEVFGWAEGNFSALFPQPSEKGTLANYTYRFYPGSGWILAVQQGQVYGFHDEQTNRQMLPVTDAVCAIAPGLCTNPRPTKGCALYDQDDFKGESVLLGEFGYDDEMPPGWDNRVRSLRCSTHSGLYLYNDKVREGDYLMIEDGGERNHLGAVASSYIYFGETFPKE